MIPANSDTLLPIQHLRELLEQRIQIIANHAMREADPAGQLEALKNVSEAIDIFFVKHRDQLDPRLRHYMANASYQKALEWLS